MRKYMVYMDDGRGCFKAAIPAADEKKAMEYVEGMARLSQSRM